MTPETQAKTYAEDHELIEEILNGLEESDILSVIEIRRKSFLDGYKACEIDNNLKTIQDEKKRDN